jgi:predicted DNA-binding protein (UPF0251 family)
MLPQAYLTDRQLEIWRLRLKRLTKAEVGRQLGITRQAVHDAEGIMLRKVEDALTHTADANMLDVKHVDRTRGILLGYSPSTRKRVIITFSAVNGVQTWHYQQPDCVACEGVDRCRKRLIQEAIERDVELDEEMRRLPPSELSQHIFSHLIPGLNG